MIGNFICRGSSGTTAIVSLQTEITAYELRHYMNLEVVGSSINDDTDDYDFALRWVGSDFNHGGTPNGLRMQIKKPNGRWRNVI